MDASKDYYAALGVLPVIDEAALIAVCRALLKKHHPDVAEGETARGRAGEIIEAYRVLRDPERRRQYDVAREAFARNGAGAAGARDQASRAWALLRRMMTVVAVGFGLRALAGACVAAALAMSPVGTRLIDALKPLMTFQSAAVPATIGTAPRAELIRQRRAPHHDAAIQIENPAVRAAATPVRALPAAHSGDDAVRPHAEPGGTPPPPVEAAQRREILRRPHGEASLFRALYGHDGAR